MNEITEWGFEPDDAGIELVPTQMKRFVDLMRESGFGAVPVQTDYGFCIGIGTHVEFHFDHAGKLQELVVEKEIG